MNYPVMHPRCRCTTTIDMKWTSRRARNPVTGHNDVIDGSVTYEQWRENMNPEEKAAFEAARREGRRKARGGGKKTVDKSAESGIINGESGISGKFKTATDANTVDLKYINSDEYKKKFKGLPYSREVNETIYTQAKATLIHRNKTDYEDMYLIDSRNGKVVGSQTSSSGRFTVEYNSSLKNAIESTPKNTLISLHNHPTENPPTGSDFASLGYHCYHSGVVACHNGKVYWYKVGDRPFLTELVDGRTEELVKNRGLSREEALTEILNNMVDEYGIKWKEVK